MQVTNVAWTIATYVSSYYFTAEYNSLVYINVYIHRSMQTCIRVHVNILRFHIKFAQDYLLRMVQQFSIFKLFVIF